VSLFEQPRTAATRSEISNGFRSLARMSGDSASPILCDAAAEITTTHFELGRTWLIALRTSKPLISGIIRSSTIA